MCIIYGITLIGSRTCIHCSVYMRSACARGPVLFLAYPDIPSSNYGPVIDAYKTNPVFVFLDMHAYTVKSLFADVDHRRPRSNRWILSLYFSVPTV